MFSPEANGVKECINCGKLYTNNRYWFPSCFTYPKDSPLCKSICRDCLNFTGERPPYPETEEKEVNTDDLR